MKNNVLLLDNQSYKIRDGHMEILIRPKEPWLKISLCQYVQNLSLIHISEPTRPY